MATCLGGGCSFGLPRIPFVVCCQFVCYFPLVLRIWDLTVSVPDHCLSFYFLSKIPKCLLNSLCINDITFLNGPSGFNLDSRHFGSGQFGTVDILAK